MIYFCLNFSLKKNPTKYYKKQKNYIYQHLNYTSLNVGHKSKVREAAKRKKVSSSIFTDLIMSRVVVRWGGGVNIHLLSSDTYDIIVSPNKISFLCVTLLTSPLLLFTLKCRCHFFIIMN